MEGGNETTENLAGQEAEAPTGLHYQSEILPSTEFVKVEKNLASLGFFTPSSKRLRNATEKSFTITTVADGKRLELKGTIIPSAKYGLPITADQDKWIALCKILTDILQREGKVTNPISFTSAEILRLLHKHRHSGKNYHEIEEWLDVLFSTTIFSEGVVYLASEKRRVKDRFRVFERAVSLGKELPDGKTADKNYVWFSDWQLQNINSNHLLPIDIEAYRELKNHIAKALVPLLQVWLYATRDEGVFEKRYDELCDFLNIQRYRYLSLIRRTLGPSLDELKEFGYLADWQIEKTSDKQNYKILFYHGDKFHRDRSARLNRKRSLNGGDVRSEGGASSGSVSARKHERHELYSRPQPTASQPPPQSTFDPEFIAEFTRRGITEEKATELLKNLKPGQDVIAQLESAEQTVKQLQNTANPVRNPAGFYIHLIERNIPVPAGFETNAVRKAREEKERRERADREAEDARAELAWEYDRYCASEVDRYVQANPTEFESLKNAKVAEERTLHPTFWPELVETSAKIAVRHAIQKNLPLLTFEEFLHRKQQDPDFSLKPVSVSPAAEEPPPDEEREFWAEHVNGTVPVEPEAATVPQDATGDAGSVVLEVKPPVDTSLMDAPAEAADQRDGSGFVQETGELTPPMATDLEPLILLASDPPPEEPGPDPIRPNIA